MFVVSSDLPLVVLSGGLYASVHVGGEKLWPPPNSYQEVSVTSGSGSVRDIPLNALYLDYILLGGGGGGASSPGAPTTADGVGGKAGSYSSGTIKLWGDEPLETYTPPTLTLTIGLGGSGGSGGFGNNNLPGSDGGSTSMLVKFASGKTQNLLASGGEGGSGSATSGTGDGTLREGKSPGNRTLTISSAPDLTLEGGSTNGGLPGSGGRGGGGSIVGNPGGGSGGARGACVYRFRYSED